jgi:tRNA(fMet)-specific endonuclease VapC
VRYLLDTNHWSYIQRRNPAVIAHIQALPVESFLYMPVIAQAELLAGVHLADTIRRKKELLAFYQVAIARSAEILGVDSKIAEQFALIFAALRRSGRPIDTNDVWIAAIARVHGCIVVSNDSHFRLIDGLSVENWVA